MEYYIMDELDIIIKEITPIQKDKYCIIPLEQVIYNSQICTGRR